MSLRASIFFGATILFALTRVASAQTVDPYWAHVDGLTGEVSEIHRSTLCGTASSATFALTLHYAEENARVSMVEALATARCRLAIGTSQEYKGNMLHKAIRNNPNKQTITLEISDGLLRNGQDKPELRQLFADLVQGKGADFNIFHQLRNSWNTEASARGLIENSARIICLSIDRYNITELSDIRTNECLTEPFYFRLPE